VPTGPRQHVQRLLDPLSEFLRDETAGGVVLLIAAVAAVVWANVAPSSYADVWHTHVHVGLDLSLEHWVNDGLMAIFFFVAGLEIKRELVTGELRDPRSAALPAIAAAGGVVLPIVIFTVLMAGHPGAHGWAIPAATDIAFAVGVLALLGARVASGVRLFLLTIAIVDDIIAIVIIAAVYSGSVHVGWVLAALAAFAFVIAEQRLGIASIAAYVPIGVFAWYAVYESGIHATIAGVMLGLLTPARLFRGRDVLRVLEHRLHPLSAFVIVPLFALANAGVDFGGGVLGHALGARLTWAVVAALVLGKLFGIAGATLLALRLRAGRLPAGMAVRQVWGVAALGGIGFTVSLFITELAFDEPGLQASAKIGIFAGSLLSGLLGLVLLRAVSTRAAS